MKPTTRPTGSMMMVTPSPSPTIISTKPTKHRGGVKEKAAEQARDV